MFCVFLCCVQMRRALKGAVYNLPMSCLQLACGVFEKVQLTDLGSLQHARKQCMAEPRRCAIINCYVCSMYAVERNAAPTLLARHKRR